MIVSTDEESSETGHHPVSGRNKKKIVRKIRDRKNTKEKPKVCRKRSAKGKPPSSETVSAKKKKTQPADINRLVQLPSFEAS